MPNQIRQKFIEDNLIIISKQTADEFLKQDAPADCITLYFFYYYTAKWQKTNQIKCVTDYVCKGLKWSKEKVIKTKKTLIALRLIEDVLNKNKKGQIEGWYVRLNYLWKQDTNLRVAQPEGGLHLRVAKADTNAYSVNNINAYSANKEMLISKEIEATPQTFGREDINQSIAFLKSKLAGTPDGSQAENRRYAKLLIDRFKKDYPGKDPVFLVKRLIEGGMMDSFHGKNITSFKYLYYNAQKIIQAVKAKKKGGVAII